MYRRKLAGWSLPIPTYSSMWNPRTRDQSTPSTSASHRRNRSCELPLANIALPVPRARMAARRASAASAAAARASASESPNTRTCKASTVRSRTAPGVTPCVSRELRKPRFGRGQHLVGHLLEQVVVDAARERVEEHRIDDHGAIALDRGLHGQLLRCRHAPNVFARYRRQRDLIAPAYSGSVDDAHALDDDVVREVGDLAPVRDVERMGARPVAHE